MAGRKGILRFAFILNIVFSLLYVAASIPEQGITKYTFSKESEPECAPIQNTKFTGSYFRVQITSSCPNKTSKPTFTVRLGVYALKCSNILASECISDASNLNQDAVIDYMLSTPIPLSCKEKQPVYLKCSGCQWQNGHDNMTEALKGNQTKQMPEKPAIFVNNDGIYKLVVSVEDRNGIDVTAVIESRADYGFLSAADWPQLPFFRTMFVLYILYTFGWLVLCCCHRSDLLRIQYWVGGVIFIGLIEKAVFLGEYETLNKTGRSVYGAIIFGELVSSAKKMLSRILVIIVSVGFGIVKPRLGTTLHKVLAVGFVYFIASSIESCLRATKERVNQDKMALVAYLVLAVIDACICWWIFSSLIQTMRTLRLRRNVVKLSLYRHFTNTLIFAVLASIGFMIWSFIEHQYSTCVQDWKELWVDEAFWHLLFVIILLVIMILWRPSANNQRYAYSPLTDVADDEAEEPMINEAFDGIKLRNSKSQENNSIKADTQMEDDLKWVDDNIPASIVDSALPSLLDSEEEIVTTTYERGKMQ